ncbi:heterokaryon incompatibility protein-domain-containing protein [Suillus paluster]|uniref:heterokaryon incompatibility protein-domain-containing protein n=1 Tax=Suillus paluster TaxID=48578 RepID=UPI001B867EC9|nr:heterokaryon incompatibility protein-domain-containing protein [Suillus paluster]KAG1726720.1 heterokaryon incompatibility protein-domain-containing protein [Suillus paluster]
MMTRLYAMYQQSRTVVILLIVVLLAVTIANGVINEIVTRHTSGEVYILFGTYECAIDYAENDQLLSPMTWILSTIWEVLALCLAVWIAVKHFRELRRSSTGGIIGDCFTVLVKTHVVYFTSFVAGSCFQLGYLFSIISANPYSLQNQIFAGISQIFLLVRLFVLGPRLILGVREYNAKLVDDSDAATAMTSIAFQERLGLAVANQFLREWKNLPWDYATTAWAAKDSSDPKAGFSYTTQTWQEIDDGENKGCNWCDILWGEIPVWYQNRKKKELPMPEETFKITVRFEKQNSEDNIVLKVVVEDDWPPTYQVECDPDDNAAALVPGRKLVWQKTSLPTRVIDCSNPEQPRLVLTKGMQGFYTALSYVWGEPQPHSLCTTNLSTYLESIDVLLLPKTIIDAIVCTHNLNLRYLWADTLCILQDSDEDKQCEIPQMCDIYQGAYVTIIAASSQKVSEGFLHNRKRPIETLLPFWCPDGKLGTISVDDTESADPSKEPVNRRAWCFQERLLSPRTLVYASHTLQYQCQAAMNDIGDIWNYLPSKELGELRLPDVMMSRIPYGTLSSDDVPALLAAWEGVLSDYTQRAVSHPSDRLVAISGIAQLFQHRWGNSNRYIAGLWERNLSADLLWYRHSPSYGSLVTGHYLAPSWSWAATIGWVVAGSNKKVGNIIWNVQSCEAIPVSDNHPLGQVKGGRLIVRAIVRDVTWDPTEPELFELKQPCTSMAKTAGEPDGARSLQAPAAEDGDATIGAGLAVEEDQIENTTHPNVNPTSASPVEHVDIRACDSEQGNNGVKPINIGRSFMANLFSKLVSCLVRRENAHVDDNASTKRLAATSRLQHDIRAETMTSHDHPMNTATTPEESLITKDQPSLARTSQSSEVTVPPKGRERHIEVGADKGKAVVVSSDKDENAGHLTGLIVVPAESVTGEFRRVGLFHVDGRFYDDDEAPYCDIRSWLDTPTEVITII